MQCLDSIRGKCDGLFDERERCDTSRVVMIIGHVRLQDRLVHLAKARG